MQLSWLAETKFMPPRLREDHVPRRRLLDWLQSAVSAHLLTLVSAPPGYGKTTLLASLLSLYPEQFVAWISLDEDDNDPARFLASLVRAVQHADPGFGESLQPLLTSLANQANEMRRVLSAIINELLENLPAILVVLDDLHLITEPQVHSALDYLLERMPPEMRLLIATRHDPPLSLARLRARGHLVELRMSDLRFTVDEVGLFLNEKQCLELSSNDLDMLQTRAEGWVAGLRLLAGSLGQIPAEGERTTFIRDLMLTDRYVFDFLAEEVLKWQEPDIRQFLLETSVLPEMTPTICQALTGRKDAQSTLEALYRRNLFLTQTGGAGNAYRYHALFAQFLQEQLKYNDPGRFAELHRRAAEAQRFDSPERAIVHYLAAELWDEAAQTIESVGDRFLQIGWFRSLDAWITALPASTRSERPRLRYFSGLCAVQRGELDKAMDYFEVARVGFEARGDQESQGKTLLAMIEAASLQQDYAHQSALINQALSFSLPVHGEVAILMAQVWQMLYQANPAQTAEMLDRTLNLALTSNDLLAFNAVAPSLNMHPAFLPNGIERIEKYCCEVLARFGNAPGLLQACTHSTLSYTQLLSGSVDAAIHEAEQALAITRRIGNYSFSEGQMHYVLGVCEAVRGNHAGTEAYWRSLLPWVEQTPALHRFMVAILYIIGRMQWIQHKFDQARQVETRIATIINPIELPEITLTRCLMRAMVALSERRCDDAERALTPALQIEGEFKHAKLFGSARVLLAYVYLQQKRESDALTQFEEVLVECERAGMPGIVLQETTVAVPLLHLAIEHKSLSAFAQRLLDQLSACVAPGPIVIPETGQTLTPREAELLKLIANGASNQDIADQLVISGHTVKVHITNIFGKLQVTSRTQAIARAHELHLL